MEENIHAASETSNEVCVANQSDRNCRAIKIMDVAGKAGPYISTGGYIHCGWRAHAKGIVVECNENVRDARVIIL